MIVQRTRQRLGPVGVWIAPQTLAATPGPVVSSQVARLDHLGYGSLWSGEPVGGGEAFARHGVLLAATSRLVVGTGVANLWVRHPVAMQGGAATLADAYPGRFVLGLGVSAAGVVARASGLTYERPMAKMRDYLDEMDAVADWPPRPAEPFPRVLGALGPQMLDLARERADGAHPFLVPVEHTALARTALGPDRLLIPHQAFVLDPSRESARRAIRSVFGPLLDLTSGSHYVRNLERLGYGPADAGTDRLLDALFAWGSEAAVAARVREHLDAGADHVLVQPLVPDLVTAVDHLERLAAALF
jgi:probable F420-dependent oxidoreductase